MKQTSQWLYLINRSSITPAALCRKKGWKRGTIITCDSGRLKELIKDAYRITAIGDTRVLAKRVAVLKHNDVWTKCADGEEIWHRMLDNPRKVDRLTAVKIRSLHRSKIISK